MSSENGPQSNGRHGFKIAVFGETGSGKSTIVSKIVSKKENIRWLEVSRDVIAKELSEFEGPYEEKRAYGKKIFDRLTELEGRTWAANRVISLSKDDTFLIVTGVRGSDNLTALKAAGFLCVFVDCAPLVLAKRLSKRSNIDESLALSIIQEESVAYGTPNIRADCHVVIDNSGSMARSEYELYNACFSISRSLISIAPQRHCILCANSRLNVDLFDGDSEICNVCKNYNSVTQAPNNLQDEREHILSQIRSENASGRPILVGISGGKDSSLMLANISQLSRSVHAFTIDTGYYPNSVAQRSRLISHNLGCRHTLFDARTLLTDEIRDSFCQTAELFDSSEMHDRADFKLQYKFAREHYSIRENLIAPYPRPCQLCRRLVIRSYYELAQSIGARYVFIGINEWVNLSASATSQFKVSGIRRLQPSPNSEAVFVVHWPFINRLTIGANERNLDKMGWVAPFGEGLIETNANSCLFAKASERSFVEHLGFHPDSTRLAREVTAGFLDRASALRALATVNNAPWTVSEVLRYAEILS